MPRLTILEYFFYDGWLKVTNITNNLGSNVIFSGYDNKIPDFYVPCFTMLEYLFYGGWLKVNLLKSTNKSGSNVIFSGYDNNIPDFYVPCFTMLEYLFYLGWLKVNDTHAHINFIILSLTIN